MSNFLQIDLHFCTFLCTFHHLEKCKKAIITALLHFLPYGEVQVQVHCGFRECNS